MESIFGINHGDKVGSRDGDEVGSRDGDEVGSSDDDETSSSDGDVSVDDASGDEIHMKAQVAGKWTTKFEKFEDFHHFFNTNITSIYMFISVTYTLAKHFRVLRTLLLPFSHMMKNYGSCRVDRNAIQCNL